MPGRGRGILGGGPALTPPGKYWSLVSTLNELFKSSIIHCGFARFAACRGFRSLPAQACISFLLFTL
jgi:hypothetical protein